VQHAACSMQHVKTAAQHAPYNNEVILQVLQCVLRAPDAVIVSPVADSGPSQYSLASGCLLPLHRLQSGECDVLLEQVSDDHSQRRQVKIGTRRRGNFVG